MPMFWICIKKYQYQVPMQFVMLKMFVHQEQCNIKIPASECNIVFVYFFMAGCRKNPRKFQLPTERMQDRWGQPPAGFD